MSIGPLQIILVLVIILIIFGAGKLPKVMGDVAKGIKNFKSGMAEEPIDSKKEQVSMEKDTKSTSENSSGDESSIKN